MKLDEEDIQRIAERVVELLNVRGSAPDLAHERPAPAPSGLVDAATLAQALGVDRSWVYAHAEQLRGIRLGGPHGRLRFDLARLGDTVRPSRGDLVSLRAPTRRSRTRRRGPSATGQRACTSPSTPPKIEAQTSMAGRRTNAPGLTPGG